MATNRDDEDLSNETETVELSAEDEVDHDEESTEVREKKKGGLGKIIGIVVGVAAIGAVGFAAKQVFFPDAPAPAPQQATQAPINVEPSKPVEAPATQPVAPVQQEAPTQAPAVEQGAIATPDVSNGPQVLPDLNQTMNNGDPNQGKMGDDVTPEATAPDLSATPATTQPAATAPDLSHTPAATQPEVKTEDSVKNEEATPDLSGTAPATDVAPLPPVGQQTSTAPVQSSTSSVISQGNTEDLNSSIKTLIQKMDGLSGSIESLNNMIGDTNDRIDKTNTNVDNLTKRVDKLEELLKDGKPVVVTKTVSEATKAVKKSVAPVKKTKAVVKKKRSSGVSNAHYNSVEIIDEDASYRPVKHTYKAKKVSSGSSSARLGGGYKLQSVISDRIWVKHPNGTTSTYGVGDRLPNGHTVGTIDPDNGVFDTNGKLLLK